MKWHEQAICLTYMSRQPRRLSKDPWLPGICHGALDFCRSSPTSTFRLTTAARPAIPRYAVLATPSEWPTLASIHVCENSEADFAPNDRIIFSPRRMPVSLSLR